MRTTLARCLRLDAALSDRGLERLLVSAAPNRRYLSGFTGSAGALLVGSGRRELFTDGRYQVQSRLEAKGFQVRIGSGDPALAAIEYAAAAGMARVGFDDLEVPVRRYRRMRQTKGIELEAAGGLVEELRLIKDDAEMAALRRAIAIADEVMTIAAESIRPGVSERAVAARLEAGFLAAGADKVAFDLIVAAGPNSAKPHHFPSAYEIFPGDAVVVDMGALVNGYHSDITRTFCAGEPSARFNEIYATVLAANRAGIDAARPGASGKQVDAAARAVIAEAGFGENFGHGLGHGVGLEIHEAPRLAMTSDHLLQAGMVHSIEPGIYLPDWGGIRIEDLVLVRSGEPEILSSYPR